MVFFIESEGTGTETDWTQISAAVAFRFIAKLLFTFLKGR
jgi:hypothetical protein